MATPVTQGLAPAQLFADFYRRKNGAAVSAEMLRLFEDSYDQAARG